MDIEIIGYIAGTLGTIQAIPQVYKVYKTKSAGDLSYLTLYILLVCLCLWTYYGYVKQAPAMVYTNSAVITLYTLLLILKYRYDGEVKKTTKAQG